MEYNGCKKIRVAQVIGLTGCGGVESVIMSYYKNIDRSKVAFDFLVESESKITTKEIVESLEGHLIIIPHYDNVKKYVETLTEIFKKGNYDIVHSNMSALSYFALKAAKKAGIKIRICHSHSTSNKKEFVRNMAKNMLRLVSKKYATDYFACSEVAGRYLFGNKTFDEGKVIIINNAIDVDNFKFSKIYRDEIRKLLNVDKSIKIIGHVGRFVNQKNHRYLIDIFDEVHKNDKDTKLLLIGDGPLKDEIQKKVNSLNLINDVIFLGSKSDIYKYYSAMDVFVMPSLYEGLPIVGVEAQTNGVPSIFSDRITKETKILDSTCFLSLKKDTSDWTNLILKSPCDFNSRKHAYEKTIERGYDIKTESEKLLEIYEKLTHKTN